MENKLKQLGFREINRGIFEMIFDGRKKVETRAASPKFKNIKSGDKIILKCENDSFAKNVKKATIFKTIPAMLQKYKVREINPLVRSVKGLELERFCQM